ncbi:MAG: HAMP domain-containing protein [Nitrospirae bacterium]|nr:HAMP domain-containing protein [Nitrospirota bacterium]MBF0535153.1 HAMP domain-containing protein [Nitrospirota bacterium]MBF0615228.1 HAMP domain-containing protein [Nitrospirota bacterium]
MNNLKTKLRMSIKKKIILSFTVSFSFMIILVILSYVAFFKIMEDIRSLETTDRIRSRTLEMRRYEKNFLNGDDDAAKKLQAFAEEITTIIQTGNFNTRTESNINDLSGNLDKYSVTFSTILSKSIEFQMKNAKIIRKDSPHFFLMPLINATFREHPLENIEVLKQTFPNKTSGEMIALLGDISHDIGVLRRLGEELISASKDLDRTARDRMERLIKLTQVSGLIFLPISFALGLALLLKITQKVVNRLKELEITMEKAAHGYFPSVHIAGSGDEVERLKTTFNKMSDDLRHRQEQINSKDEQLHQSKQLAALGTLASGVAHELNNPLNNIHLAAQTLTRALSKGTYPEIISDSVNDIHSQTMRMKKIVSDLLEFVRSKKPQYEQFELYSLISDTYRRLNASADLSGITFSVEGEGFICAGHQQLEQVFINLFINAIDAMGGHGTLKVYIDATDKEVSVKISDTGAGIAEEDIERIFEPFYTKKGKGTGLGLFITYNIIKNYKGDLTVESTPGTGTTFTITLPVRDTSEES